MNLKSLEKHLVRSIVTQTNPKDVFCKGSRYEIYKNGYIIRLCEALKSNFEKTHDAIGFEQFAKLALEYIRQNPSFHPNINLYGHNFPKWIKQSRWIKDWPFLYDMVILDESIKKSFEAQSTKPFQVDTSLYPNKLANACLLFSKHALIKHFHYSVIDFPDVIVKSNHTVLFYKCFEKVYFKKLKPYEANLFIKLKKGLTLNQALADLKQTQPNEVYETFLFWISQCIIEKVLP